MVLHRNDQQTLLEFANKLIIQRLTEIQALLDGVKAETTTPADAA